MSGYDGDRLYLDLKGSRERLCRAQTHIESEAHREQLQVAINAINRVGSFHCPQWSKYDLPTTALELIDPDDPTTT